ncbi:hypothetical protein NCS56_01120600 [Fusarium sp. Ph1]|nr:hypothetical protein NCS56_01120600 [Fusarium sp. Ph1]
MSLSTTQDPQARDDVSDDSQGVARRIQEGQEDEEEATSTPDQEKALRKAAKARKQKLARRKRQQRLDDDYMENEKQMAQGDWGMQPRGKPQGGGGGGGGGKSDALSLHLELNLEIEIQLKARIAVKKNPEQVPVRVKSYTSLAYLYYEPLIF